MRRFRHALLVLLPLVLLASGAAAWGGWSPAAAAPKFAVVPASHAREGQGHLDSLRQGAAEEGFLDRMLGTNCFSQAVGQLTADCRRMEQETKTRLALSLMNCQLQVQQGQTFPCHRRQTIKECTEGLTDRAHALFVEFLTHADSMCLHIQNQNFEKYTENMLDRLAEGASFAREQLAAMARGTERLGKDTAALQAKAEAALGLLHQHTELEEESMKLQREAREEAASYFSSLDTKQQRGLNLQDQALQKQAALEQGQAAALRMLEEAEGHMGGLFELVEGRAADLAAAAAQQAEAQRRLAGELGGLVDSSHGIRTAVDVVISYQQRSDSVLMRLLGKSYSLEDVAFFGAGTLAAMAAGTSAVTARAKLPLLALVGGSMVGERMLLDRLHWLMSVDDAGQVRLLSAAADACSSHSIPGATRKGGAVPLLLRMQPSSSTLPSLLALQIVVHLPMPMWLQLLLGSPAADTLQLNYKSTVRWVTVALAAGVLLYCVVSYCDFEKESYRLLLQLEADQERRHQQYIALINRNKVELAAMMGGAAGDGGDRDTTQAAVETKQGTKGASLKLTAAVPQPPSANAVSGRLTARTPTEAMEEEEEEGGERWELEQRPKRQADAAHDTIAGAVATPAAKAARAASSLQASKPSLQRNAGVAPAGRKRGAEEAGAASGGQKKRRAGGRRRSSETEVVEDEEMTVYCEGGSADLPSGAQRHGKRARRGSAEAAGMPDDPELECRLGIMAAPAAAATGDATDATNEFGETVAEQVSREIFAQYECRSAAAAYGHPHPGDIAEPASLSAIPLPPSDYPLWDALGGVAAGGKLSQLQLEGVLYACTKHLTWLPSGERCGFFIGDGAGVGKGRQISGIILDNYVRGRRKSVWLSTSTDLYADAVRDLRDLGSHIQVVQNAQALDRSTNTPQEGCLFLTYSTLISNVKGRTRLQQVIDWLGGPDFDGPIILDECHKAKNHVPGKEKQSTKVSSCVLDLQRLLPRARFVYCSATGVSEVANVVYCQRLGLWGPGAAFADFQAFLDSMKRRGITFLEMLSMELKGDGLYVSRGLSFREAEFSELECRLTSQQTAAYDAAATLWQDLRSALLVAQAATGSVKDPWKPFWAAQQRFFKLLCVSLKVGAVVKEAKEALAAGYAVVIGLQSTGEAATDSLHLQPGDVCGFISTTRQMLVQFVEAHFPTTLALEQQQQQQGEGEGEGGQHSGVAAADSGGMSPSHQQQQQAEQQQQQQQQGGGEEDATSVQLKASMLERIADLDLPPNFLDQLIDELGGAGNVAEMTGRKARVVRNGRGRLAYTLRAKPDSSEMDSLNIKEKQQFMDAKKLVAIVSDAASTGISLHASAVARNQRRRIHLTIELPWSADKAIQQLGRSHRSNQLSAPIYKLVFTSVGGERRFAAAVARRLQSLGALTRGDRRAASGLDLSEANFDSPLGRKSLRKMYDFIVLESPLLPPGVNLGPILEGIPAEDAQQFLPVPGKSRLHLSLRSSVDVMGIGLSAPRGDTVAEDTTAAGPAGKDMGDVRRFLNRLLGLPAVLGAEIRAAKAEGKYFEGVSDLPGQDIARAREPQRLWVDHLTGLPTMRHDLTIDRGASFEHAVARLHHERTGPSDRSGFRISRRPMFGRQVLMLALQKPGAHNLFAIVRPNTGPSYFDMDIEELDQKYSRVSEEEAREGWEAQYEASLHSCMHGDHCQQGSSCQVGRRLTGVTILSGSVVRIWDCLERVLSRHELELSKSDRVTRIVRVDFADGSLPLIGVRYPAHLLPEVVTVLSTQQNMGSGGGVARRLEPVTPVQPAALKKAFTAPKTVLDFFKRNPAAAAALASGPAAEESKPGTAAAAEAAAAASEAAIPNGNGMGTLKRPASQPAAAAGSGKKQAAAAAAAHRGGGSSQHGDIAAAFGWTQKGGDAGTGSAPSISAAVVDLAAEASNDGSEVAAQAAAGAATSGAAVLKSSTRHNGGSLHAGLPAAARWPMSGRGSKGSGSRGSSGGGFVPGDAGSLDALIAMGFTSQQAERALRVTQGNLERAANFLLTVLDVKLKATLPIVINTWAGPCFGAATAAAWETLAAGGSALDAGCTRAEELQCDRTVGFGGSPDEIGETTLDAMVFDGDSMRAGAVADLRRIKAATSAARLVMAHTSHSLLAGEGASRFAKLMGLPSGSLATSESVMMWSKRLDRCQPNFWHNVTPDPAFSCGPYRPAQQAQQQAQQHELAERQQIQQHPWPSRHEGHDTIAMVAIHASGSIAAAASSNGATHKVPGRVGDGAIPGGGAYADSAVGGCGATGDGDVHLRFLPCYQVVESMRQGLSPTQAAEDAVRRIVRHVPDFVGALVAVSKDGRHGGAAHGWQFAYSVASGASGGVVETHHSNLLFASVTASTASRAGVSFDGLQAVPAAVMEGSQQKQYAWDGRRLRALEAEDWLQGAAPARTLRGRVRRAVHDLHSAFFPHPQEVSPDYWEYSKYRAWHRLFSSMSSIFATQSLLQAVGVGARRSLPAAATINWVLKDGLGRLGRLTRFRFTTSIVYALSLSLEFLTPLAPQHFLVMASLANVGKSIGLTTFIATQPAFHRSFCLRENLADISAKTQAQQMVMDNLGLAAAVGLTYLCRHTEASRRALPLIMFPLLAAGDLWSIYRELRSIHLRTLNKERAEIIAQHWLAEGRVPTPRQVSEEERFVLPPHIEVGRMPLVIGSLDRAVCGSADLELLQAQQQQGSRDQRYFLTFTSPGAADADEPGASSHSSSHSSSSQSSSSHSSSRSNSSSRNSGSNDSSQLARRQRGAWGAPALPWRGGLLAGSVRVCLRQDAAELDIVQVVLQAAYLRQLLGVPPAGSRHPVASAADDSRGAVDVRQAVADSASKARSSLKPFIAQLQESGWQLAPFMLSSTEKRRYLQL
ncbi:Protein strawberry notch 1 [Chlorella vulgaris]